MTKTTTTKRYSHAFDVAFEIDSDHPADEVTAEELYAGLERRLADLRAQDAKHRHTPGYSPEILEACGAPFDTNDRQDDDDEPADDDQGDDDDDAQEVL